MYTLYHQDGTRSGAALLVLEEGGLDYDLRHIDITVDEHRSEGFLAVNPRGLIPTLVTDTGEVVCETAAIMMYLADRHGWRNSRHCPTNRGEGGCTTGCSTTSGKCRRRVNARLTPTGIQPTPPTFLG